MFFSGILGTWSQELANAFVQHLLLFWTPYEALGNMFKTPKLKMNLQSVAFEIHFRLISQLIPNLKLCLGWIFLKARLNNKVPPLWVLLEVYCVANLSEGSLVYIYQSAGRVFFVAEETDGQYHLLKTSRPIQLLCILWRWALGLSQVFHQEFSFWEHLNPKHRHPTGYPGAVGLSVFEEKYELTSL